MSLWEGLRVALAALNANKLRSALTMLGMIIGVAAVITLMSVGKGAQAVITSQIQSIGTNLLFITPGAASQGGVRMEAGSKANLTIEDAQAIFNNVPTVVGVAPEVNFAGQVVAGSQNYFTKIVGVTPDYEFVRNFPVASGVFISQQDVDGRSLVAVLGSYTAQQLFGEGDPTGERIRVNNVTLTVIGVLAPKGGMALGNQDDLILVPLTTLQQRLARQRTQFGGSGVNTIYVQVSDERLILQTVQAIGEILREQHRVLQDDFTVTS
ncbi:MAG: ABC transporter permease, partial [Chloroflexi bacterium]|nr:ABC transporter permease [Chloroflexota bacterium]